ncbi:MAG: capsular polysaccharide export protein [Cognaticolwellia sp.]|jgi:capsular polysaccharide export protein
MKRVIKASKTYKCIIVTGEPLVWIKAKASGIQCYFISSWRTANTETNLDFLDSIEFLNGSISKKQCENDTANAIAILRYIVERNDVSHIVIWNGQQLLGRAFSHISAEYNIKKVYLELSNFKDKLFVDPEGVNALSSIAKDVDRLTSLQSVSESEHAQWLVKYEKDKTKPLPQAQKKVYSQIESLVNRLLKFFLKGNGLREFTIKEFINKSGNSINALTYDEFLFDTPYIFLPLQVSSDTQLKLHSDYDNKSALAKALQLARNQALTLVVKPHPAEQDIDELTMIDKLKAEHHFILTNENTIKLIKSSELVVTINSTVGLETLALNKKLLVLGHALYADFDQEKLKKYIHHYLVNDIDFFADEVIQPAKVKELLSYAN